MKEKVLKILQQINSKIVDGIDLISGGIIESFEVVKITMELEEAFGVEIDAQDYYAENFQTVDTITALIEKYVDKKNQTEL